MTVNRVHDHAPWWMFQALKMTARANEMMASR